MLLAYAFLWGGAAEPAPVPREAAKQDVDSSIEQFLIEDILRAEGDDDQVPRHTAQHSAGTCDMSRLAACSRKPTYAVSGADSGVRVTW